MSFVDNLIEAAELAGTMAWETLWALVLGFTIAGAVEAFVSEERMSAVLGGRGPRSVTLGTLFGAASSSCSFGAVATTKSLFKKGASAEASLGAFQFASTNLVIELGLVMWVLLGWQFVAANVAAGLLLIVLMALYFRLVVPSRRIEAAREHVRSSEGVRDPVCGMEVDPDDPDTPSAEGEGGTVWFCSERCRNTWRSREEGMSARARLLTARGWSEAFANALKEWGMLWKDIAIGFVVAGLIGAFVPREWWATLFDVGAGVPVLSVVLACALGVIVGVITFVCSVGNVPFALILWKNGIPFGGVMSFIFADLIVPNIVDAYRRYYGWAMAAILFAGVFACAVVSGVAIHYLWTAIGLAPESGELGGTAPKGHTPWLNAVFGVLLLVQIAVTWRRRRA